MEGIVPFPIPASPAGPRPKDPTAPPTPRPGSPQLPGTPRAVDSLQHRRAGQQEYSRGAPQLNIPDPGRIFAAGSVEKALPCPLPSSALGLLRQPGLGLAASAFICPIGLCQYLFRALGSLQGTPGTFSNYARGAPRSGGFNPRRSQGLGKLLLCSLGSSAEPRIPAGKGSWSCRESSCGNAG